MPITRTLQYILNPKHTSFNTFLQGNHLTQTHTPPFQNINRKKKYIYIHTRVSHSHRKLAIRSNQRPLTGSIWWNRITTTPIRMAIWPPCTWAQSLTIRVLNCFSPPSHASTTPEWFQSVSNSSSLFVRTCLCCFKARITQLMSFRRNLWGTLAWESTICPCCVGMCAALIG